MGDYTPSTDEVRFGYAESVSPGREPQAVPGFDRWLAAHDATVRADHEKAVRERIVRDIRTENIRHWREHRTTAPVYRNGYDEAMTTAARIVRVGA